MLLYHGCAQFESITKEGLTFERDRTNDFGEGESLASCGGTYFSDSLKVAAFYALNASSGEAACGGEPCVFAVEIDDSLLIADEDKSWDALRVIVEKANGKKLTTELPFVDAEKRCAAILDTKFEKMIGDIQHKFLLRNPSSEDIASIRSAVRAFIIRSTTYEWSMDGSFADEIEAIDRFCSMTAHTVSRRWFSEHYDDFALSCRTHSAIAPMGTDGPASIVGSIVLRMDGVGLKVTGIEYDGVFDEEDVCDFQEAYIEKTLESSGCEVEAFDLDDLAQNSVAAYA